MFAALWASFVLVAPRLVIYHPGYGFLFEFTLLVLAGGALGRVHEQLFQNGPAVALASVVAGCCLNLPATVSYFRDGSRHDYRAAARFVDDHFQPGDRIACGAAGLLKYYTSNKPDVLALPVDDHLRLREITRLASVPGRLWIVVASGRSGLADELREWLGGNCAWETVISKTRLDYYSYEIYIFLRK